MKLTFLWFIKHQNGNSVAWHGGVLACGLQRPRCQCMGNSWNTELIQQISVCMLFTIHYSQIKSRLAKTFHNGSSIEVVKLTLEYQGRVSSILLTCMEAGSLSTLWKRLVLPWSGPSTKQQVPRLLSAICWKQCGRHYGNTCDVRNSKQPWLLHFAHTGKLKCKTGKKDCLSSFPNWGR